MSNRRSGGGCRAPSAASVTPTRIGRPKGLHERVALASTCAVFSVESACSRDFLRRHVSGATGEKVARQSRSGTQLAPVSPVFRVANGYRDDRDLVFQGLLNSSLARRDLSRPDRDRIRAARGGTVGSSRRAFVACFVELGGPFEPGELPKLHGQHAVQRLPLDDQLASE